MSEASNGGIKRYSHGTGSLGPGRCTICKKPWIWNVWRRLYVADCWCRAGEKRV